MEPRISLVTLGFADLPRARSFYEALGWEGAQQPDDEVCFFQARRDGPRLVGSPGRSRRAEDRARLQRPLAQPEEVGAVLSEAERAGGTVLRPAARAEWGGTSGAFADPDGYVWEVAHNPGWTLDAAGAVRI